MKISVLFIQRKEDHEGQHMPEALCVADEVTLEEYGEIFEEDSQKEIDRFKREGVYEGHTIVDLEIDDNKIKNLCKRENLARNLRHSFV